MADLEQGALAFRPETVEQLGVRIDRIGNIRHEASRLLEFLKSLSAPAVPQTSEAVKLAVIHDVRSAEVINVFAGGSGAVTVASPYCTEPWSFDLVCRFVANATRLEVLVSEHTLLRLPRAMIASSGSPQTLGAKRFRSIGLPAEMLAVTSALPGRETTMIDIMAGYIPVMRAVEAVVGHPQKPKLFVTGPGCVLNPPVEAVPKSETGIACENLHSIRFTANAGTQADFVDYFEEFCREIAIEPGDAQNIKGDAALVQKLAEIADVVCDPPARLSRFRAALEAGGVATVEFTGLEGHRAIPTGRGTFDETIRNAGQIRRMCHLAGRPKRKRVLFVCPAFLPTLQLSFIKPFQTSAGKETFVHHLVTQEEIAAHARASGPEAQRRRWLAGTVRNFAPDVIVFCRYGGPHEDVVLDYAAYAGVPTICHVDSWLAAFEALMDPETRFAQVQRAQDRLSALYTTDRLFEQIKDVFEDASARHAGKAARSGTTSVA